MGVYEWVLMGVIYAATLVAVFTALALEIKKNKKLEERISQELLRSKMKLGTRIFFIVWGVLMPLGATACIICCSILIEPAPKVIYAIVLLMVAFLVLICSYGFVASLYNFVSATEEGVWVSRVFVQPKFYGYDEIGAVLDTTYTFYGGYTVSKKGGKKMFTVSHKRDKNAKELIALLKERAPALKRWGADEVFPL